ncbi:MAG TPA: hypothetical protein VN851_15155 [Thermoanaerobaculia bacterium]|nr:hypothetical protein [Thermoanaerobaculia bacterium]
MPLRWGVVGACTLVGGVWLALQEPIPVIRVSTPLPEAAPFWYMLLAFPILGLLLADLLDLFLSTGVSRSTLELGFQIGLIVLLSSARLAVRLPVSGHSLLVSYFIFRRLLLSPTPRGRSSVELWLAVAVFAAIAYPKLAWWNDPVTLLAGVALGALLSAASRWIARTSPATL